VWQLFGEDEAPPPVYAASIGISYRMTPLAL
jgi:hypothetical protein